ncbi:MAG: hypothetical protein GF320_01610, partial [Armatimonadia bacterium]|nr:hypothetical protein [Armatimonadia bacterium]
MTRAPLGQAKHPQRTTPPAPDPHARLRMGLAVGLGLMLIPVTARWLAEIEWVRYSDNATT